LYICKKLILLNRVTAHPVGTAGSFSIITNISANLDKSGKDLREIKMKESYRFKNLVTLSLSANF
jgi:hypothetical protein